MEYVYAKGRISIAKKLLSLDEFVLSFTKLLEKAGVRYVIVSGYVGIFFGRSRNTEDVDILIERCGKETFAALWSLASRDFECMNAKNPETAYARYLDRDSALRFHKKGEFIPNIELKFTKNEIDDFTLENRVEIVLNKSHRIFFPPMEMQVAYKLYLGSEKDIEDSRFLYGLFGDKLDKEMLRNALRMLDVPKDIISYLGEG